MSLTKTDNTTKNIQPLAVLDLLMRAPTDDTALKDLTRTIVELMTNQGGLQDHVITMKEGDVIIEENIMDTIIIKAYYYEQAQVFIRGTVDVGVRQNKVLNREWTTTEMVIDLSTLI